MIKKELNGFTLTEALVAIVIGMISVAAIFFSYQAFNKAFKSVEAKAQMNSNARDALSQMTRELRNTCRVCLLYTSPSPRDRQKSRMPSSA